MTRRRAHHRRPRHGPRGGGTVSSTPALVLALAVTAVGWLAHPLPAAGQEVAPEPATSDGDRPVAIVVHGGAGTLTPQNTSAEREQAYRAELEEALRAGHDVLTAGGEAVDAVVAAIQVMERSPLFNAGVGAVFTSEGTVEHDASIMDGRTRNSGATTGTGRVFSPIALARLVMDSSRHVMFAQEGAEAFARQHGIEMVPNDTFYTDRRREAWRRTREGSGGDGLPTGTVGAVALDSDGDLAAGTSTGGMTNKRFGRIGDSPVVGAGTYADNETAGVSATGHGEYFIRGVVAHDVAAMMRYAGVDLSTAASGVVHGRLGALGGTGGIVALDGEGNVATPFNTPGMLRGWVGTDGEMVVKLFRD